jgi:hypothetical protein
MSGVGGVRSSDNPVPDLWSGKPAGERRDATCSAVRKRNEELVTALWAISAMKVQELQPHAGIAAFGHDARNSESRMRENRPSGLMRGGKQLVIGPRASQSTASRLLYTPTSMHFGMWPTADFQMATGKPKLIPSDAAKFSYSLSRFLGLLPKA